MIRGRTNNSGIILFVVLWIMAILSLLAIGLGWQTHIELTLAKNYKGKIQSKYNARSGLTYAMDMLTKDKQNNDLHKPDLFNPLLWNKQMPFNNGFFKITRLQDEEAKINLNGLTETNNQILSQLMIDLGIDSETASTVSSSIIDWKDENMEPLPLGAENNYYAALGYGCKNKPLDSIEELLLVKGMTNEIFQKIKNFITIYPMNGPFAINMDYAPKEVLSAFAKSLTGAQSNTSPEDADSLVNKIMDYRNSLTDPQATAQERILEANKIGLNGKESAIFLSMQSQRQRNPKYIDLQVQGTDEASLASTIIDVTLQNDDLSILRWQRN